MGLFGKSAERLMQEARERNRVSKQSLIRYLSMSLNGLEDEGIKDEIRFFINKVESYNPCADDAAAMLDRRIEDMMQVYFKEMFKMSSDGKSGDADLRAVKAAGNKDMFSLCAEIIDQQLFERKTFMEERAYTQKELKAMPGHSRRRYEYCQAQREAAGGLWDAQMTLLEYSVKLKKLAYEKKYLQAEQEKLLEAAKNDIANADDYGRRYTVNLEAIKDNQINQDIINKQLLNNVKLKGMIAAGEIEDMVGGRAIADKVKKYSKEYKRKVAERKGVEDITDEYFAEYDAARDKAVPGGGTVSDRFRQDLEGRILEDKQSGGVKNPSIAPEFFEKLELDKAIDEKLDKLKNRTE